MSTFNQKVNVNRGAEMKVKEPQLLEKRRS